MSTLPGTVSGRLPAAHYRSTIIAWAGAVISAMAPGAWSAPTSAAEFLAMVDVQDYRVAASGDVAWVEREKATRTVFVARAPHYRTEPLIRYPQDDGQPVALLGFASDGAVVHVHGQAGFNPGHAPLPSPPRVLAVGEGGTPRVVIEAMETDATALTPGPDGRHLFLANGGTVYRTSLEAPAEPTRLFTVRGTVTKLLPSADGQRIAFISDRSNYERGKYAFAGVFDGKAQRITWLAPGLGIDQDLVWSPDGDRLAFIRFGYEPKTWRFSDHRQGAPFDVVVVDATTGEGGPVFTSAPGYGSRFNGFGASGYSGLGGENNLLWLADDRLVFPYEKTGWKQLYAVPAGGGPLQQLTRGKFEVDTVALSADRSLIHFLANSQDDLARLQLYTLPAVAGGSARRQTLDEEGAMPLSVRSLPGGGVVYPVAGASSPERLVVAPGGGDARQLSTGAAPGDAANVGFPAPEVVGFRARDGLRIQMILYRPPQLREGKSYPAVVHSHGGPRSQARPVWQTDFSYRTVLPWLASQGYFVFSVNFRSGTGYGLDFREPESYGGRGAGDAYDFIDAAAHIEANFPEIDAQRIAIYGHSYGGHNVTNALARSGAYAAGISSAGVGDWVVEMEKDFEEELQFDIAQRVELERQAYESSAVSVIDDWGDEPLLLLHGDNDGSAALQQSLELYTALRRRGKPVQAVVFPGEAHTIARHDSRLRYLQAIEAFLAEQIGSPTEDSP